MENWSSQMNIVNPQEFITQLQQWSAHGQSCLIHTLTDFHPSELFWNKSHIF